MNFVELDPSETVLLQLRKHWFVYVTNVFITLFIASVPFIVGVILSAIGAIPKLPIFHGIEVFGGELWLFVIWVSLFALWTNYYLDLWIITDHRLFNLDQVGLFDRQITSCSLERIQEITVHTQNVFETLLGYGTLEIQTAGPTSDHIRVEGIAHPEKVREIITGQIEHFGALEDANKKQEQLLHFVAHEVKGYLSKNAAVLASIVEGDYGSVPTNLQSTAGTALSDTRQGVSTVMDILEGSNLGAGTVQYSKKPFDLAAAANAAAEGARAEAEAKGLTLTVVKSPQPCIVSGDEEKIAHHVLRNLVDNAVKYTPKGSVTVGTTVVEGSAVFWVQDTGVGITPEDMQKLFTEGGRGKDSKIVNPSSTGFGLFVAKQIVDAHEGRIWADSDGPGKGSSFYVLLPLVAQAEKAR